MEFMAVAEEEDGMIFCSVDCLKKEYPMMVRRNRGTERYEESDLRRNLNGEILERFPKEIRKKMLPFKNGDLLRVPTEFEITGDNQNSVIDEENVKQWIPMREVKNRIALSGEDKTQIQWYWLQNVYYDFLRFTYVNMHGCVNYIYSNCPMGVRVVLKLKQRRSEEMKE